MSPYITTTNRHLERSRQNTPRDSARVLVMANVTLIALAVCCAIGALVLMHSLVSHGYELRILEKKSREVGEVQERLERTIAELRSLELLSARISPLGLVAAQKLSYPEGAPAVAQYVTSR